MKVQPPENVFGLTSVTFATAAFPYDVSAPMDPIETQQWNDYTRQSHLDPHQDRRYGREQFDRWRKAARSPPNGFSVTPPDDTEFGSPLDATWQRWRVQNEKSGGFLPFTSHPRTVSECS